MDGIDFWVVNDFAEWGFLVKESFVVKPLLKNCLKVFNVYHNSVIQEANL